MDRQCGRGEDPRPIGSLRAGAPTPPAVIASADACHWWRADADSERRIVTVMFCDIADSATLESQLGADVLGEILQAYRQRVGAIVGAGGGRIIRTIGDGILAIWGYPRLDEDDGVASVRAGLQIAGAFRDWRPDGIARRIAVRIGLEHGIVLVGRMSGTDELDLVGKAANEAAGLQLAAPPGGVVIGAILAAQVAPWFVLDPFTPAETSGGAVASGGRYIVAGERQPGAPAAVESPPPLRGRRHDLARISQVRTDGRRDGAGIVLVTGEPGIGKSALCACAVAEAAAAGVATISIASHGRRHRDGDDRLPDRLLAALAAAAPGAADAMATSGTPPPSPAPRASPTALRLFDAMHRAARARPLLVVIEDVDRTSPGTLACLGELVHRLGHAPRPGRHPLLLLATARRPACALPATLTAGVQIELDRIAPDDMGLLLGDLAPARPLAAAGLAEVSTLAEGNPLFARELAELRASCSERPLLDLVHEQPSRLLAALTSGLDELRTLRPVLQAAAVIGPAFDVWLLERVLGVEPGALSAAMERLAEARLVGACPDPEHGTHAFSYRLLREVVLRGLPATHRRRLHRAVADALVRDFPGSAHARPDAVAEHFDAGGAWDEAFDWWRRAARAPGTLASPRRCRRALEAALAAAVRACDIAPEAQLEVEIAAASHAATAEGPGHSRAAMRASAGTISGAGQPHPDLGPAIEARALLDAVDGGRRSAASDIAQRLARSRDATHRSDVRQVATLALAVRAQAEGMLEDAAALYRQAAGDDAPKGLADPLALHGLDLGVIAAAELAFTAALAGGIAQSRTAAVRTLALAATTDHAATTGTAYGVLARRALLLGEVNEGRELAAQALVIARAHGLAPLAARSALLAGAFDPDPLGAANRTAEALAAHRDCGLAREIAWAAILHAQACAHAERRQDAATAVEEALAAQELFPLDVLAPEVLRRAAIIIAPRRRARAEVLIRRALADASRVGARLIVQRLVEAVVEWESEGGIDRPLATVRRRLSAAAPDPFQAG